eukprot:CAMPEP_0202699746 /NCGR_PEP_ID=MMETSP1385-20130828/12965_1 /ASSEMBLY_ACC=CAM_ASM_000861 /TAXON_ID=933848 /ORGANISM="Elphidium margaritaceum" /LENGTH=703 /DNA_ID=CAMNT_0049356755 /DNA_START=64 /DNA_END=2175 /DNA_ORIENTATION=+
MSIAAGDESKTELTDQEVVVHDDTNKNNAKTPTSGSKKKKKKKKKNVDGTKKKKKLRLEDLMDGDISKQNDQSEEKKVVVPKPEPRKSVIHMIRKGLTGTNSAMRMMKSSKNQNMEHADKDEKQNEQLPMMPEGNNVQVAIRIRPVNQKERDIEHRLLFRTEFDFDDSEYDHFLAKRQELLASYGHDKIDEFKAMTVDQVCDWLDEIKLEAYKKRFRRRKVNGEWLWEFPQFNEKKPLEIEENTIIAFTKGTQSKRFQLDHVLNATSTQDDVFQRLGREVVNNIIEGFNCCIFAFGQTGTGKTHTMFGWDQALREEETERMRERELQEQNKGGGGGGGAVNDGDDEDGYEPLSFSIGGSKASTSPDKAKECAIDPDVDGLIPRIIAALFEILDNDRDIAFFNISCAFIEIYQETLRDLIRPRLKVQLRYVGMNSELVNLSWHDINNYVDMANLIDVSRKHRMTAATLQNETSSRSHCIIQLKIELTLVDGTNQTNKLSFGDLAGSEKLTKTGATGARLSEAKKIVKSLFSLKKVIRALSEKKAFVPYQDSVLTKLLRDSLGGNSLTLIVCNVSPHAYNREETVSTLRFAEMAKKIKNEALVNRMVSRKEMETQINSLRDQLQYFRKQQQMLNRRSRFTSTDFNVLHVQLADASKKAEEMTQKYLQAEIQLLMKTQYTQELETEIQRLRQIIFETESETNDGDQ